MDKIVVREGFNMGEMTDKINELVEGYNELKKKLPKQYDSVKEYIEDTF